jgi:hypothetical protein
LRAPIASAFFFAEASLLPATPTMSTNPRRLTASTWCGPTKPAPMMPIPIRFTVPPDESSRSS